MTRSVLDLLPYIPCDLFYNNGIIDTIYIHKWYCNCGTNPNIEPCILIYKAAELLFLKEISKVDLARLFKHVGGQEFVNRIVSRAIMTERWNKMEEIVELIPSFTFTFDHVSLGPIYIGMSTNGICTEYNEKFLTFFKMMADVWDNPPSIKLMIKVICGKAVDLKIHNKMNPLTICDYMTLIFSCQNTVILKIIQELFEKYSKKE